MAINYSALKNEILNDPNSYGYAPLVAVGNDTDLAVLLNLVRAGISIKRPNVSSSEILEAIDIRDFLTSPAGVNNNTFAASWFESITQFTSIRLTNEDNTKTVVRKNIDRMVADTQGSQTRLDAVAVRSGSRAEQLFGFGTSVSANDVAIALRQTP